MKAIDMMLAAFGLSAAVFLAFGCSSGLQERAWQDENGNYIVSRSLVNDRVTANQPHTSGTVVCAHKRTSEEMAKLSETGDAHSWYTVCQPIERYAPGVYQTTSDQPVATLYKGPVEAALLGTGLGLGLAYSGDTITQSSRAGAGASSSATATAPGRRGRH